MNKFTEEECGACDGTGYQTRNDGITIECPVCDGDGVKQKELDIDIPRRKRPDIDPEPIFPRRDRDKFPKFWCGTCGSLSTTTP